MSPVPVTRRIRSAARVLCASLAGIWMLGMVSALLHSALVPHVTCAVHGELIHGIAHAEPARRLEQPTTFDVDTGSHDGDDHSHEHCAMMQTARARAELSTDARPEHAPVAIIARVVNSIPASTPLERILLAAPKTSPPSA